MNFLNLFKKPMTVQKYFEEVYQPHRLLTASPKTIAVYQVTLRFFDEFCGRPATVKDMSDERIAKFAAWRLETVSRGTVKRDMDCLLALARFAFAAGLIKTPILIRPIHAPVPTPIALTREQIDAVWQAMKTETRNVLVSPNPRLEVPGHIWWEPLFLLAWDTAERITPVFTLLERDINLDRLWVRFPAENRKGSGSDNVKPIHPDTAQAIERLLTHYHKRQTNSRVFRWSSNDATLWPRLGAIMDRAGLPDAREFKFHCIRKSSVSHFAAAGGDGTAHAGHSSNAVTRKHYYDPTIVCGDNPTSFLFRPGEVTSCADFRREGVNREV